MPETVAEEFLGVPGLVDVTHARACSAAVERSLEERAAEVDRESVDARIDFIKTLGTEYMPGATRDRLAEVWGLKPNTVTRDAGVAWREIQRATDPTVDHRTFFSVVHDQIQGALRDVDLVVALRSSVLKRQDDGSFRVSSTDVKMIAEASAKSREIVVRTLELLGRASGIIQSGNQIAINVSLHELGNEKVPAAMVAAKLDELLRDMRDAPSDLTMGEYLPRVIAMLRGERPGAAIEGSDG